MLFSTAGKVCVPLLTLLSGYGLTKSFQKYRATHKKKSDIVRFMVSHLLQLYSLFIFVGTFLFGVRQLLIYKLSFLKSLKVFGSFVLDCCVGFVKSVLTLKATNSWFVMAIIIMYVLFPIIFYLTSKLKFGAVILLYIPWIVLLCFPSWDTNTDSTLFYLYALALGVYFAQNNTFEKIKEKNSRRYKIGSAVFLVVSFLARLVFSLPVDGVFAVAIIFFEICVISNLKLSNKILYIFGKHSANIWLLHPLIIALSVRLCRSVLNISLPILVKFLVVILLSLIVSFCIDKIEAIIKYDHFVRFIRKKIES